MLWKRCWYDDWSVEYEWCSENGTKANEKGDTVFCRQPKSASFDLFENYEDRGNQFSQYVINK
jgi:UDP-N-acetylmuramoylalanine-D-glutamate ligase